MLNPKISVIIPCRNEERYIEKCIDSILRNRREEYELEILICDALSTDNTRSIILEMIKKNTCIKLIDNPDLFTPQALNLGVKNAIGDYIIIFGAHAIMEKDYISEALTAFSIDPNIACVGGVIYNEYENDTSKAIGLAMSSPIGVGNAHFRTGQKEGFVDTVGFGVYKKSIFSKIGLFNPQLARNQDDEFNFRIIKSGYKIYLSKKIKSRYFVRTSLKKLYKQYYQYGYWKVYVNKLHRTITTIRQLAPFALICFLISVPVWVLLNLGWLWTSFLVLYILILLAVSIRLEKQKWRYVWLTLLTLHFSYGIGYFYGVIQIILLRNHKTEHVTELTR